MIFYVFITVIASVLYTSTESMYLLGRSCSIGQISLDCRVRESDCGSTDQLLHVVDGPGPPSFLEWHAFTSVVLPTSSSTILDPYRLNVSILWGPPVSGKLDKLQGFHVNIYDKTANRSDCFIYNISESTERSLNLESFRFNFTDTGLINFGSLYRVVVQTLPVVATMNVDKNKTRILNRAILRFATPYHPANDTHNCTEKANSDATGWEGGFLAIDTFPVGKKVVVYFVAAPPSMCLEDYEVRLYSTDGSSMMFAIQNAVVYQKSIYQLAIKNTVLYVGNHTIENLEPGLYEVGLLPIDRSSKYSNRCLCPHDDKSCSCHEIVTRFNMTDPPVLTVTDPCQQGACPSSKTGRTSSAGILPTGFILCISLASALMATIAVVFVRCAYKRYSKKMGFTFYTISHHNHPHMEEMQLFDASKSSLATSSSAVIDNSTHSTPNRLLVIYSHDSTNHCLVVQQLVDFMIAAHHSSLLVVDVDFLCKEQVAENKLDWVCRTLHSARKILLIQSAGAYTRCMAKIFNDKNNVTPAVSNDATDDLFTLQLEFLAQARATAASAGVGDVCLIDKLATVRFAYTPDCCALPIGVAPAGRRYSMPQHTRQLLDWLLAGITLATPPVDVTTCPEYYNLCQAIDQYESLLQNDKPLVDIQSIVDQPANQVVDHGMQSISTTFINNDREAEPTSASLDSIPPLSTNHDREAEFCLTTTLGPMIQQTSGHHSSMDSQAESVHNCVGKAEPIQSIDDCAATNRVDSLLEHSSLIPCYLEAEPIATTVTTSKYGREDGQRVVGPKSSVIFDRSPPAPQPTASRDSSDSGIYSDLPTGSSTASGAKSFLNSSQKTRRHNMNDGFTIKN